MTQTESFRFTSIEYNYIPTTRGRPMQLWLQVASALPPTLYIGAVLTIELKPVSFIERPELGAIFNGRQLTVSDIIGKRIAIEWPTPEGQRRAQGLDPFFGKSFGVYVTGKATFRLMRPRSRVPESSHYEPAYYDGKISTANPYGLIM